MSDHRQSPVMTSDRRQRLGPPLGRRCGGPGCGRPRPGFGVPFGSDRPRDRPRPVRASEPSRCATGPELEQGRGAARGAIAVPNCILYYTDGGNTLTDGILTPLASILRPSHPPEFASPDFTTQCALCTHVVSVVCRVAKKFDKGNMVHSYAIS